MNQTRLRGKYDEILTNRTCLVLHEEVATFRTYLQVHARFIWEESPVGAYHIEFKRGLIA